MPGKRKSWREKREIDKTSKRVVLSAPFAGVPAGATLFVGTPRLIDEYIRKIPAGTVRTMEFLRNDLARRHRADATCPASTAIFVRIAAEAAWDELQAGAAPEEVTPFWRVVEPGSKLARKLRCDPDWIAHRRTLETGSRP